MAVNANQETQERWDKLPAKVREAILSNDNYDFLENLGQRYTLSDGTLNGVMSEVSNVLYGLIHPEDLQAALSKCGVSDNLVPKIYSDVKIKIFDPLQPELSSVYSANVSQADTSNPQSNLKTNIPTQQVQLDSQTNSSDIGSAPFILHHREEQEDLKPRIEEVLTSGSPIRPIFYTAPKSESEEGGSHDSRPIVARLELGIQEQRRASVPTASQSELKGARVVNYSDLRTKLDDPFAAHTKTISGDTTEGQSSGVDKEAELKDIPV